MSSISASRTATRLWLLLPVMALAGCGGNNTGAVITVPNSVVAADLRNAGVTDVVVASARIDETGLTQPPGLLQVILNTVTMPGTFGSGSEYQTNASPPAGLAVGDLTGNGTHDLVVANITTGTLAVFMETSPTSGTYNAATTVTVGGEPNDVQIADLNGDGLPDLIVADNTGKVTYLLQKPGSPGTFGTPVSLPISDSTIASEGDGFIDRAISVAVGDLNADGLPDLAVTSFDNNGNFGQVSIFFQDPANPGSFLATPTVIDAYGEPSQIKIADLNQDGANDIVIAVQGLGSNADINGATDTNPLGEVAVAEAQYGALVILQNSASPGTFSPYIVYPGVSGSIGVAVADLNMDGLPDLALVSLYPQGQGEVAVLLQETANPGLFQLSATLTGIGQPVSIAIADLNNDGLPDLVTADATSAAWYSNTPSAPGTFAQQGQIGFANQ